MRRVLDRVVEARSDGSGRVGNAGWISSKAAGTGDAACSPCVGWILVRRSSL